MTLFILPCDNPELHDPEKAKNSFGAVVVDSYILDVPVLDDVVDTVKNPWFAYIYSDETIDEKLRDALPIFLKTKYDCLVLMKKVLQSGEPKCFQSPRIFRRGVQIQPGLLIPKAAERLNFERVLDGWIL